MSLAPEKPHRSSSSSPREAVLSSGALLVSGALLAAGAAASSCAPRIDAPPADRPAFPTGLAVLPDGEHLLVVSSNFDLDFDRGALLAADLSRANSSLGDEGSIARDAFVDVVYLPSFGDRPVVTSGGELAFVATRGDNLLVEVDLRGDGGLDLACVGDDDEGDEAGRTCDEAPAALGFPAQVNDPFAIAITNEVREDGALVRVEGVATLLASPDVWFWSDDVDGGNDRLRLGGRLTLSEDVEGVRGLALLPREGRGPLTFAAAQRRRDAVAGPGPVLFAFEPRPNAPVFALDLREATGSLEAREIAVVPNALEGAFPTSLVALLREPDAIARLDVTIDAGGAPRVRVGALQPTCSDPSSLATARLDPDGAAGPLPAVVRALVSCFDNDALLSYDPATLTVDDALRFFGRGPYDVVVNDAREPAQAYVSFFLEGSVGVVDLVEDGEIGLFPRGKLGEPLPPPETGRE